MVAEHARLDLRPDEEHRRRRPVIGAARRVLLHPSAELAEHHRGHAPVVALRLEIALERRERLAELPHEVAVRAELPAVGVESAHRRVVDARRHAVADHRADRLQLSREPVAGVGDERLLRDRGADPVARHLRIERGAHEERLLRVPAARVGHPAARVGRPAARAVDAVVRILQRRVQVLPVPAEERRALERDRLLHLALERERGVASDGHRRLGPRRAVAGVVEVAADPARALGVEASGLPDVHRGEVRAVRVRVADALDHLHQPLVVELLERREVRMQPEPADAVERQRRRLRVLRRGAGRADPDLRARAVVLVVAEGDHGVEAVVASAELDHDQDALLGHPGLRREQRVAEHPERAPLDEAGDGRRDRGERAAALEEEPSGVGGVVHGSS